MEIVHTDVVINVPPGTTPAYNSHNPLLKLLTLMEQVQFAASHQFYVSEQTQFLFPIADLTMYGPAGSDHDILDPTQQDNKTDFQKQNVEDFHTADTFLVRGLAATADWTGPYLRISYRGGPDSLLSQRAGHALGGAIKVAVKVGNAAFQTLTMPYNTDSDRYGWKSGATRAPTSPARSMTGARRLWPGASWWCAPTSSRVLPPTSTGTGWTAYTWSRWHLTTPCTPSCR